MIHDDLSQFSRRDTFDSRDAQKRIEELGDREDNSDDPLDEDEAEELRQWRALREEAEQSSADGWRDGIHFISDYHFEDYARELAESIGAIDDDAHWPSNYIDWPAAAAALKGDYSSIDIHGTTFWVR